MRKCCVVPCLFAALAVAVDAVVAQVGLSPIRVEPSSLFVIDQHRTTVVERIVNEWGDRLAISGAQVTREQLKVLLDFVNAHREDAHAKPVSEPSLIALRLVTSAERTPIASAR